jgi:hypothetical protein
MLQTNNFIKKLSVVDWTLFWNLYQASSLFNDALNVVNPTSMLPLGVKLSMAMVVMVYLEYQLDFLSLVLFLSFL